MRHCEHLTPLRGHESMRNCRCVQVTLGLAVRKGRRSIGARVPVCEHGLGLSGPITSEASPQTDES